MVHGNQGRCVIDTKETRRMNTIPPPVHIERIVVDRKGYEISNQLRLPPHSDGEPPCHSSTLFTAFLITYRFAGLARRVLQQARIRGPSPLVILIAGWWIQIPS
jgi:hypothetical protein